MNRVRVDEETAKSLAKLPQGLNKFITSSYERNSQILILIFNLSNSSNATLTTCNKRCISQYIKKATNYANFF